MERDPMEMALSIDIILDIVLSHLKVRDLLSCRLASKFWCKAASSVTRKRSTMIKNISDEGQLMEIADCMERSWDFPFARLKVNKPWRLNSGCAMEFFQNYGDRFTHLFLDTSWVARLNRLAPFIHHLPRLYILEVGHAAPYPPVPWELLDAEYEDDENDDSLKLSSVRTLRISSDYPEIKENILRQVLTAASPLLKIECLDATPAILKLVSRCGKLGSLSILKFDEDSEASGFRFGSDQYLPTELPALTKLGFIVDGSSSLDWLIKVLNCSQRTLKELHLEGRYIFKCSWSELPVLTKLTKMSLCAEIDFHHGYLFDGCDGHHFPALKELILNIKYRTKHSLGAVLSAGLLIVPSVRKINLEGYIDKYGMKELARSFPNVVEMRLNYGYYAGAFMPCGSNPFEIWNVQEFKHLEKLKVWNYIIKRPTKKYINLDSFLTGIPVGTCKKLRGQKRIDLISSTSNEVSRDNSNILQLENLKELVVCVKPGNRFRKLPEDPPFMSTVSVWYALEMMPSLRAKFVYEDPSPPSRNEERDKSVLVAAFKHVQEYVKLERINY